jgi:hypothetical protein
VFLILSFVTGAQELSKLPVTALSHRRICPAAAGPYVKVDVTFADSSRDQELPTDKIIEIYDLISLGQ